MKLLISLVFLLTIFNLYSFDIDMVFKLVQKNKLSSVDDLLKKLPKELIDNQILIFNSFALQGGLSTPTSPRVILFSEDAKFILSYFGKKPENNYFNNEDDLHQDKVEIIQFQEFQGKKRVDRFNFFDLTCPSGKKCKLSKPNPQICLSCHQSPSRLDIDPRPIWSPYATWAMAYPLIDRGYQKEELSKQLKDFGFIGRSEAFNQFRSLIKLDNMNRFSGLPARELENGMNFSGINFHEYATTQAQNNNRYKILTEQEGLDYIDGILEYSNKLARKLNLFTRKVSYLNFLRLSRIVRNKNYSNINRLFILEYLNSPEYAPSKRRSFYKKRVHSKNVNFELNFRGKISYIIDALFTDRGVDTEDWDMDNLFRGGLAFKDRFGTPGNPGLELSHALMTQDTNMQKYFKGYEENSVLFYQQPNKVFYNAIDRALLNFKAVKQVSFYKFKGDDIDSGERKGRDLLVRHCIRCHSSLNPNIPRIYFDNEEKLKKQLKESSFLSKLIFKRISLPIEDSRLMPPGGLNSRDLISIKVYLEKLNLDKE